MLFVVKYISITIQKNENLQKVKKLLIIPKYLYFIIIVIKNGEDICLRKF